MSGASWLGSIHRKCSRSTRLICSALTLTGVFLRFISGHRTVIRTDKVNIPVQHLLQASSFILAAFPTIVLPSHA